MQAVFYTLHIKICASSLPPSASLAPTPRAFPLPNFPPHLPAKRPSAKSPTLHFCKTPPSPVPRLHAHKKEPPASSGQPFQNTVLIEITSIQP